MVLDIDGVRQAMLRGDGAGIATLEVANDKAFTSISTRTDTGREGAFAVIIDDDACLLPAFCRCQTRPTARSAV